MAGSLGRNSTVHCRTWTFPTHFVAVPGERNSSSTAYKVPLPFGGRHYFGRAVTQDKIRSRHFVRLKKTKGPPAAGKIEVSAAQKTKGVTTSEMKSVCLSTAAVREPSLPTSFQYLENQGDMF